MGSLKDFLSVARLTEQNHDFSNQKKIIQSLLEDHETIIRNLRKDIVSTAGKFKDLVTSDFVAGLMEKHEKMAWMIRAYNN